MFLAVLVLQAPGALAQSTVSPQSDWNGNYGFASTSDRNLRLLQSDLIKKAEEGYYESIGRQTYNVTNNVNTTNDSSTTIGQQTTAIGAVNNSSTSIEISDSWDVDISTESTSNSTGCQDAHVSLENTGLGTAPVACN